MGYYRDTEGLVLMADIAVGSRVVSGMINVA